VPWGQTIKRDPALLESRTTLLESSSKPTLPSCTRTTAEKHREWLCWLQLCPALLLHLPPDRSTLLPIQRRQEVLLCHLSLSPVILLHHLLLPGDRRDPVGLPKFHRGWRQAVIWERRRWWHNRVRLRRRRVAVHVHAFIGANAAVLIHHVRGVPETGRRALCLESSK